MSHCDCDFCEKQRAWEEEYETCYRCTQGLSHACVIAEETGEPCNTVLDMLANIK
jgi:hypothetical protein